MVEDAHPLPQYNPAKGMRCQALGDDRRMRSEDRNVMG